MVTEQLQLGYQRAEQGTKSVIDHNFDYAGRAQRFVTELPSGAPVDAEYLRRVLGDPPVPNLMGAVLRSLAKRKLIVKVGYRPSPRPERHGAEVRCYVRA